MRTGENTISTFRGRRRRIISDRVPVVSSTRSATTTSNSTATNSKETKGKILQAETITKKAAMSRMPFKWAYGITTVPSRRESLFPRTLASLKLAGFDKPRLFVDGDVDGSWYRSHGLGLEITCRYPAIRTYGNWILSLIELYIREPTADRYAIFQDDFVTYVNLREYLDKCIYPEKGYLNLYTFPSNQQLAPAGKTGWYLSNQMGRGAVALVFSVGAVRTLLTNQASVDHLVERPQDAHRGHKAVDGGIVTALKKAEWKEYVHNPSLVQHTGIVSSMGNPQQLLAPSFRGENYNAMDLLKS